LILQPTAITTAELFPLAPNDVASEKLGMLFSAFKACVAVFADPNRESTTKRPSSPVDDKHARIDDKQARVDAAELERLRMAAKAAQTELGASVSPSTFAVLNAPFSSNAEALRSASRTASGTHGSARFARGRKLRGTPGAEH
jgi:hypothetical protein